MKPRHWIVAMALAALCVSAVAMAQRGQFRGQFRGGGRYRNLQGADGRVERNGVPDWKLDEKFKDDVFTFVRIRYRSTGRWAWDTDYPDADLNFSYRLQQLTSLHTDPDGVIIELTDPRLFDYPFIYIIEPGYIYLEEDERQALRTYLLNGGFLMVDDFWGEDEWKGFWDAMKQVFPEREYVDLPLEHPIFHCVYDLKERPQIPAIGFAQQMANGEIYSAQGEGTEEVHYRALFDDNGRMMAFIGHNTDLGDGWEREGEDPWYFKEFSEKKAYPLGINVIFYAMTH
ncbi:MAG: DUF4159 domain-containing protein [Planctomycetota bacterium]|nr:MAG: DUF4159 domain-containing protein [Planctomycetota bacterium]